MDSVYMDIELEQALCTITVGSLKSAPVQCFMHTYLLGKVLYNVNTCFTLILQHSKLCNSHQANYLRL